MNRTIPVIQGKNNLFIFGECPHCKEPMGMIPQEGQIDISKCYCRGADGLSFMVKCCYILNCITKNKTVCNILPVSKLEYPVTKWNIIVRDLPRVE